MDSQRDIFQSDDSENENIMKSPSLLTNVVQIGIPNMVATIQTTAEKNVTRQGGDTFIFNGNTMDGEGTPLTQTTRASPAIGSVNENSAWTDIEQFSQDFYSDSETQPPMKHISKAQELNKIAYWDDKEEEASTYFLTVDEVQTDCVERNLKFL